MESVKKPIDTQEKCDAYAKMAKSVNEHNAACKVGDTLWNIEDGEDTYTVVEAGVLEEVSKEDRMTEIDILSDLVIDQEYRLILLENDITE
jgi:hypothetical protein